VFTLNNYTEEELERLQDLVTNGMLSYILFGREVGEQGTPHLQGYCETPSRCGLRRMKTLIGNRAHLEKANGSLASNQAYCRKEDENAFEDGLPAPPQGARTDLVNIKEKLDRGATIEEIAIDHFGQWVRYRQSFTAYRALISSRPRTTKTKVYVLVGPTGTGKTRFVYNQAQDSPVWCPGDYNWFDGYEGQRIVLFDDYRGEYPLPMLLKLLDRYPMKVPVKGAFVNWAPTKVYITSNVPIDDWYANADSRSLAALKRRIDATYDVIEPLFPDIPPIPPPIVDLNEFICY
jgi:hypothetical protein